MARVQRLHIILLCVYHDIKLDSFVALICACRTQALPALLVPTYMVMDGGPDTDMITTGPKFYKGKCWSGGARPTAKA